MALVVKPGLSPSDIVQQSLKNPKKDVKGTVFQLLLLACLLFSLLVLLTLLVQVFADARPVFQDRGVDFLTTGLASDPAEAGVWQGLWGSFFIAAFVVILAFPTGIAAAVYLEEYARRGRLSRFIQVNIRNLAGVPSVVYGILGLTLFVQTFDGFTGGRSVISAGLTMSILVLPIVIITSAEAVRAVPQGLREAGYGVGSTRWEVTRDHVLPYAAPGILTGTVLSLSRALGEAAPLILVGAVSGLLATGSDASLVDRLQGPFTAMPYVIYNWAQLPDPQFKENLTAAAILVLLVVVLLANTTAILLRNRYEKKRVA